LNERQQISCQRKMPHKVYAELHFKAVIRFSSWRNHHSGIVDEHIQFCMLLHKVICKFPNQADVCEVQHSIVQCSHPSRFGLDFLDSIFSFLEIPCGNGHMCTCFIQRFCCFKPNTGV